MEKTRGSFLIEPPAAAMPASLAFLRQARFALGEEFFVKISRAIDPLSDPQVWQRPNEESNSIGNLMLHLAGNARQWIVVGIGGATDVRDRPREFAERNMIGKAELLALLRTTIEEADAVLAGIERELAAASSDEALRRVRAPQGFDQTVLDAICHVVQHFSYHTGQIVFIAKMLAAGQIRFYDDRLLAGEE
jgi:uncharacterized damage-inducible protein DinB